MTREMEQRAQAKAEQLTETFAENLRNDELLQQVIAEREQLQARKQRLEAGVVALLGDLEKTENSIERDRLSLAIGDDDDVLKVNKRVAGNLGLLASTKESIEAMRRQVEAIGDDLHDIDRRVGSVAASVLNRLAGQFQAEVDAHMDEALVLCNAHLVATGAAVRAIGGSVGVLGRSVLSMGAAAEYLPFINMTMPATSIPTPAPKPAPKPVTTRYRRW